MINDFKKLNPIQKELYRQLYKKSFYEFAKAFWETADPQKFVDGILVQFYCETFQYMARGWVNYDGPENPIPNIPISGSYFTPGISICSLIPKETLPSLSN